MHRLNLITKDVEEELFAGHPCEQLLRVGSLVDLRNALETQCDRAEWTSLDLIAHTTRDHRLLRVGTDVLDLLRPRVRAFFEELAAARSFADRRISRVRLLGCESATRKTGLVTMQRLSRILGVPVFGSKKPLMKSHFDALGFNTAFEHILVEAAT